MSPWTADKVKLCMQLLSEGMSASRVAARLGPPFTRNSIIGQNHRQRIRDGYAPAKKPPKAYTPRKTRTRTEPSMPQTAGFGGLRPLPPPMPLNLPKCNGAGFKLIDLGPNQCRFAVTDHSTRAHLFCGDLVVRDGCSWCDAHERVVQLCVATATHQRVS